MPLAPAMSYADHALQFTMEFGQGSLIWLERNDINARSKMASLIRRGYTGASALEEVYVKLISIGAPQGFSPPCLRQVCLPSGV